MDTVFGQPKSFVSGSITRIGTSIDSYVPLSCRFVSTVANHDFFVADFAISPARGDLSDICAIHTRIGGIKGNLGPESDTNKYFFSPKLAGEELPTGYCRSWSIVAKAASFDGGEANSVHVFALPLGWRMNTSIDEYIDDDDEDDCQVPFYLSCRLVLPPTCRVKEIAFYGDDGNSSLSAAADDVGTGKEGRQAMGLLVSCPVTEKDTELTAEELWLLQYDRVSFQYVSLPTKTEGESLELNELLMNDESIISIQPVEESRTEDSDEQGILYAKSTCHLSRVFVGSPPLLTPSSHLQCGSTSSLTKRIRSIVSYSIEWVARSWWYLVYCS